MHWLRCKADSSHDRKLWEEHRTNLCLWKVAKSSKSQGIGTHIALKVAANVEVDGFPAMKNLKWTPHSDSM